MTHGRCLCGALRYEIDGPFVAMLHCHCSMCRKHHGTAYATWAAAPLTGFRWTGDKATLVMYRSSERGSRAFCSVCGSVAPILDEGMGMVIAPAGNLEEDPGIRPGTHMFVGSKAPWYTITDTLPQHAEYPPEFGAQAAHREPVTHREGIVQGSCLCGDVAWEITAKPQRFFYCHCSRCRLARSAAHATNVFYKTDGFKWIRGEDKVRDFPLPGAQYFAAAFCSRCGSKVPRVSTERGLAVVPAGSLDDDPGIRAQAHIFVDSRAAWDSITDDIPQFAEMPPRR